MSNKYANTFSQAEFYRICRYIAENKTTIEQERMNVTDVSKFLAANLTLVEDDMRKITSSVVRRALDTLGDEAPKMREAVRGKAGTSNSTATLRSAVYRNRRAIREIVETLGDEKLAERVRNCFAGRDSGYQASPAASTDSDS